MSFPDFDMNERNPSEAQAGLARFDEQIGNDWSNLGGNDRSGGNQPETVDLEEEERIAQRREEETLRRKAIEEKMNEELRGKEERRAKAMEFMSQFQKNQSVSIGKRKAENILNEKSNLSNRELAQEGKKNPWERVVENINIKESDYKGSKNVARMRTVIINRKNDSMNSKQP